MRYAVVEIDIGRCRSGREAAKICPQETKKPIVAVNIRATNYLLGINDDITDSSEENKSESTENDESCARIARRHRSSLT